MAAFCGGAGRLFCTTVSPLHCTALLHDGLVVFTALNYIHDRRKRIRILE